MKLATPSASLITAWEADWETRQGFLPAHTRNKMDNWAAMAVSTGDVEVGIVAAGTRGGERTHHGVIADVWISPEHRRNGYARQALELAEQWCRDHGARRVSASIYGDPRVPERLMTGYTLSSRHMRLAVGNREPELPDGVVTVPMDDTVYATWREHSIVEYARYQAGGSEPSEEQLDNSRLAFATLLPLDLSTPDHELMLLLADGEQVATLWLFIDSGKDEVFIFDVEVAPAHRGKGHGRAVMGVAQRRAIQVGVSYVRLHVHEHNAPALRLYEKLGYRTTGRHYQRQVDG